MYSENTLLKEMGEFSLKTFSGASSQDHMRKLKIEADESIENPLDIEEYADCLLALYAAVYKQGFNHEDLTRAAVLKFEKLRLRKWKKQLNGTYQHIQG